MTFKIRTRLAITHISAVLLTVLIFAVTAGMFTGVLLPRHIDLTRQKKTIFLIKSIEEQYLNGRWESTGISRIGARGLLDGFTVKVTDPQGKVLWDAWQLLGGGAEKTDIKEFPLTKAGQKIGTVEVGFLDAYFLAELEVNYLAPLNKLLALLALVCILLSLAFSRWAGKGIEAELAKIRALAELVAQKKNYDPEKFTSASEEIRKVLDAIKHLELTIDEQERVKKRMTTDLAHELRTPLTTLQANLEGLLEGILQPTPERLNSCYEEILRIIRLLGELEQLSKYETDQMQLNLGDFDLGELLSNTCLNFQGAYRQKGVALEFQKKQEMLTGDRDKISQLVVNLLSNSLKHTPAGGKVMLMTGGNQDFSYLVLNDSGAGIPPEDLARVFDRLYRSDTSRTRSTGGSGIGLAIARAIVQAHRGTINIVSQVGVGTEVTVVLPRTCENKALANNDKE